METEDAKKPPWMEELAEVSPAALTLDGFDDAYVGFIDRRWTTSESGPVACYSRSKCIEKLMDDGMSHEEAEDFFEALIEGCGVGDG